MTNKQLEALVDSIMGVFVCQSLLLQFLIKKEIITREEIGHFLDSASEQFQKEGSEYNKSISEMIDSFRQWGNMADPFHYPSWLQDLIGGGDSSEED